MQWLNQLSEGQQFLLFNAVKLLGVFSVLMGVVAYVVLLERKICAFIQDRVGPNRVGLFSAVGRRWGLGQPLADAVKSFLKEDFTPAYVRKAYFWLAPAVILIPFDLEPAKVLATSIYGARVVGVKGTYDDVNRLCSEIAGKYGWGFVNVNLRPFYAEGSKSFGYEVVEQLGWKTPAHIVVPMAGGSLVTKIGKAFGEMEKLGLLAAGGCVAAVDAVMTIESKTALALTRPPGHHATPTQSMGFCLFNNVAPAADHARRS